MKRLPSEQENVPREEVAHVVRLMLQNEGVGSIVCREEPNRTYRVIPHPHEAEEEA